MACSGRSAAPKSAGMSQIVTDRKKSQALRGAVSLGSVPRWRGCEGLGDFKARELTRSFGWMCRA